MTWCFSTKASIATVLSMQPSIPSCLLVNSLRPSDIYICISKLTIIGSDNGLSPGWCQAIIWTNAGILLIGIGPLGTNFSETLIKIHTFAFKEMQLKISSGRWRAFCFELSVLTNRGQDNGCHFAGNIFKFIFTYEFFFVFWLKFHWNLLQWFN